MAWTEISTAELTAYRPVTAKNQRELRDNMEATRIQYWGRNTLPGHNTSNTTDNITSSVWLPDAWVSDPNKMVALTVYGELDDGGNTIGDSSVYDFIFNGTTVLNLVGAIGANDSGTGTYNYTGTSNYIDFTSSLTVSHGLGGEAQLIHMLLEVVDIT